MHIRTGCAVARKIADVLLQLFVLGITGFLLFVLVDLRGRHDSKITAPDPSRTDGRNLALMLGPPSHPDAGAEYAKHAVGRSGEVLQESAKPVGTDAAGNANQGMSVALSADGSTAIVGGPGPSDVDRDRLPAIGPAGAAWIFIRRDGVWAQQGGKLVGTTNAPGGGLFSQGAAVALSADGNTAIVGGPSDNRTTGAAWVFVRSGSAWEQQGEKLVGTSAGRVSDSGLPLGQGTSVALSADGDTAIVGGWRAEGAWVFTRSRGVWSQQGKQLVGSGAIGMARQGASVALSADGNTAMVGGWSDHDRTGAVWVFTRRRGSWSQQGKKLVGSGAVGAASQGMSLALSADGNTALIGGPSDNPWDRSVPFGLGPAGAAWVFIRNEGGWTQQGEKLVSSGAVGTARQGMSVALSADGNVAIVGGLAGEGGVGTATVFTRNGTVWAQGEKLVSTGAVGKSSPSVAVSADSGVALVGGSNDNGGIGATWAFAQRAGQWSQEQKLVGAGEARTLASSVPPATDAALLGRSEDSGRLGAAADSQDGRGLYADPTRPPPPE
jgi:hypothetical protein